MNKNKDLTQNRKPTVTFISMDCFQDLASQLFHSLLINNGYDVKTFYIKGRERTPSEKDLEVLFGKLKEVSPFLIGISVRSSYFYLAKKLTQRIKEYLPEVKIIWGGVHPSILPKKCIPHADYICIGEGEEPLLELAEKLYNGKETRDIPNIWSRENGNVFKNPSRTIINDLEKLPVPAINDGNQFYIYEGEIKEKFPLSEWVIMTSRGCPFKCSFCGNRVINEVYKRGQIRRRSVEKVIEELLLVKEKLNGVSLIVFNDDVFTFDRKWVKEFVPKYKEKIGMPFLVIVHPVFVKEDIMELLKDAGLHVALMGIQSGSERIRSYVFLRKTTNQQIIDAAKILKKINIPYRRFDIIHDNPFETRKDCYETLDLLLKMPRPYEMNFFVLTWFPKTRLTERALEEGIIKEDQVEGNNLKMLEQFRILRGFERSKEGIFFANLYYLAVCSFFPRPVVRFLSKFTAFEKNPAFMDCIILLVKILKGTFFFLNGFAKIFQGKGSKESILGGINMLKRYFSLKRYDY